MEHLSKDFHNCSAVTHGPSTRLISAQQYLCLGLKAITLFQSHRPECRIGRITVKDDLQLINNVSRQVSEIALVLGRDHDPLGASIHSGLQLVRQRIDAHEDAVDSEVSKDTKLWYKGPCEHG